MEKMLKNGTPKKNDLTQLFVEFFESEQASGIVLILCTVISIAIANSSLGEAYSRFWNAKIGFETGGLALRHSVEHWINDGLMAIFFLLIGLEIERELYVGELSDLKKATLPIFAAVGGMATPALIHSLFNAGGVTQAGASIPMATDIAFALGVLALLGKKVPVSLKVFLTALAIIDDLGAITVIALFYAGDVSSLYLVAALAIFAGLLVLNRAGGCRLSLYLIAGAVMWYLMLRSGIHATVSGVLLAFAIPFSSCDEGSPSYRLQHFLHKPVTFVIMPLFALANTNIALTGDWRQGILSANSVGIFAGLFLGKPLGVTLFCAVAIRSGLSRLPGDMRWRHVVGAGFLAGIGFTMSFFIALLAFDDPGIVQSSKISVLIGSLVAGTTGFLVLKTRPS